jgi:hypothetical protein
MERVEERRTAEPANAARSIIVAVNEKPVVFQQHRVTGAEIKATAIAQGVSIQQDFVLFEVKGAGHLKQIGDEEIATRHEHAQCRAVAPDDNS